MYYRIQYNGVYRGIMMCAYFCIVEKQYLCSDTKYFCDSKHPLLHDSSEKNTVKTSNRNLYMWIRKCEKIWVQKVYKSSFVTHIIINLRIVTYLSIHLRF